MKFFFNKKLVFILILWMMFWAGYNTSPQKPDFSHPLQAIHAIRAFFPILAGVLALILLIRKKDLSFKILRGPLGLLLIYASVGVISLIFLSIDKFLALYWAACYISVLFVLFLTLSNEKEISSLKSIINLNWIIVFCVAIFLFLFLLFQPGVISSLTSSSFIKRPYEGLGGIGAEIETLGMAGTRATGLGRYVGLIAIFTLARTILNKERKKILWYLSFLFFFFLLYFSQAKTAIFGFILVIFIFFLLKSKSKIEILGLSFFTIFLLVSTSLFLFYPRILMEKNTTFPVSLITPPSSTLCPEMPPATTPPPETSPPATPPPATPPPETSPPATPPPATPPPATPTPATPTPETPPPAASCPATIPPATPTPATPPSYLTLSGRTTGVWTQALGLFLKSPLIGWGFHADRIFLEGQHAHNAILHALLQTGIIGTIPFILAFILSWIILFRLIKQNREPFLIEIAGALAFFTIRSITESSGAFFGVDWLIVAPLFAYLQCREDDLTEINQKADYSFVENNSKKIPSVQILGNRVHMVQIQEVLNLMTSWIQKEKDKFHWIVVTGMHGIMEAYRNSDFKAIIKTTDLFVPDGISLIWIGRWRGFNLKNRVAGADLMREYFKLSAKNGYKNFFYGDTEKTLKILEKKLLADFPELKIAGFYSPPFRSLTSEEEEKIIDKINQAKPDVLWVALGLPKQERWIFEHKNKLEVPVVIGVGAAFKFLSGEIKRAPIWMGNLGLEWLWRLFHEPRRVWRRVLLDGPLFLWLNFLESLGIRHEKD